MEETKNQQIKAKKYEKIKLGLSISETVISLALILVFVISGLSAQLRDFVYESYNNPYLRLIIFIGISGAGFSILTFPFSYIGGFWLEHRYNLSNQSFLAWIWEQIKALLVGIVLFLPLVLLFFYFLRNFPDNWWLLTATILFLFSVIIGRIAPQIILPLFYKFEHLDDEDILNRMKGLAEKGRFKLNGIYRFNMSKNTKKANAAFTGIGKSKRIILGDTLLDSFSADEIETVFAHEVGHYVHKHLMLGVITGTISSYLSLYLADIIYKKIIGVYSFQGIDDLAVLPALTLILSLITIIFSPLSNAFSRKHERQADRYALKNSSQPSAFISALEKLAEQNLADKTPHPLVEFLFHSHPSLQKRIQFSQSILNS